MKTIDLRSLAFTLNFNEVDSAAIRNMDSAMDDIRDSMEGVGAQANRLGSDITRAMNTSPIAVTGSAMDTLRESIDGATEQTTLMGRAMQRVTQSQVGQVIARGMDRVRSAVEGARERVFGLNSAFDRMRNSRIGERIGEGFSRLRGIMGTVVSAAGNMGSRLRSSMDGFRESIRQAGRNLAELQPKMENLGKSMMTKVTAPIVAGIGLSINEFAKLEQSIGGVETLFKGSASVVIANSETAYKRAGVSANSYMENITSFSASLLQGLGGDTEKAVRIADMAMVDMSDNANKFGSDIGSVQNAYQGFSKSNFTMLDNLNTMGALAV